MAQPKVRFFAFMFDDPKVCREVCRQVKQRLNEEKSIAGGAEAWVVGRDELYLNQRARWLRRVFRSYHNLVSRWKRFRAGLLRYSRQQRGNRRPFDAH